MINSPEVAAVLRKRQKMAASGADPAKLAEFDARLVAMGYDPEVPSVTLEELAEMHAVVKAAKEAPVGRMAPEKETVAPKRGPGRPKKD